LLHCMAQTRLGVSLSFDSVDEESGSTSTQFEEDEVG
jgi:hypothetical protein